MNRWEAVCAMLAQCSFEPRIETIPTVDAVDRVLAHPVCTKIAQPPLSYVQARFYCSALVRF
jgi:molybdopterin biosynthesis enzyme